MSNYRQDAARLRKNVCLRHNTPMRRLDTMYASACSLGCIQPEVVRVARLAAIDRNRWWAGKYGPKP